MTESTQETTMTPDDLDRIVRLAKATTKAITRGECRVDAHDAALAELTKRAERLAGATNQQIERLDTRMTHYAEHHDAALAELRKEMTTLQHEFVKSLKISMTYTDSLEQRISDAEERIENPTPPAVPDAFMSVPEIDESHVQIVVDMGGARSKGEARRLIARGGVAWDGETLRVGKRTFTTPTPPPLVDSDKPTDPMIIAAAISKLCMTKYGMIGSTSWVRALLGTVADLNATRVPDGDDQDDTPDVGGE